MLQNGGYLYITTGADEIIRYDGSTTLVTYGRLDDPAAPTVTGTGAGTTYNHYYRVAAVNSVGFSTQSATGTDTLGFIRSAFDDATNYMTVTGTVDTDATRVDVYYSEDNSTFFYLGSAVPVSGAYTFKDDGSYIPNPGVTAPIDNTTTGPRVEELTNVGSRMYGVRDRDNSARIWFTGAGANAGSFSVAYDGGYLDWQEGGKFIPVKVEDYRDGKGTPLATVWCKSADGQGCILQMSLDSFTVGDVTITIPSAFKLPGSRGTPAPASVVNVLNDYLFYNSQAFYNLGSRVNLQQILSTDEISANIRPSVRQISTTGEEKICSVYFDARVFFSVPYGTEDNNYTAIYDTERKAWLPKAFTMGFRKFLRYTDNDGIKRLLCVKPGDSRLSEISYTIEGDYGEAFSTSLKTGLYPTDRNRFEFQWTEEAEVEFSTPRGRALISLMGIERSRDFITVASKTLEPPETVSTEGWGTFLWGAEAWGDVGDVEVTSESSIKRYFPIQRDLNAVQWTITTSTKGAYYILRTLQTWGTQTQAGKPRSWRL